MFLSARVQPTSQSEQRLAGHKPLGPARVLLNAFRIDNMEWLHQARNSRSGILSGAPRQFLCLALLKSAEAKGPEDA